MQLLTQQAPWIEMRLTEQHKERRAIRENNNINEIKHTMSSIECGSLAQPHHNHLLKVPAPPLASPSLISMVLNTLGASAACLPASCDGGKKKLIKPKPEPYPS